MTPSEAKRKLFWYDCKTFLGVALFIGLTAPFAAIGVVDVFCGLFVFVWWQRRHAYRPIYEASLGQGPIYEALHRIDGALRDSVETLAKVREANARSYNLCPTCQSPTYGKDSLCTSLHKLYPHRPCEPPPSPNPFEWSWYKGNGYPPPPPDQPKDLDPLLAKLGFGPDSTDYDELRRKGRAYYQRYGNPLWDNGYGKIPDWYVPRQTILPQPLRANVERARQESQTRRVKSFEERQQWYTLQSIAVEEGLDVTKFVQFAQTTRGCGVIIGNEALGFNIKRLVDKFRLFEASQEDERLKQSRPS